MNPELIRGRGRGGKDEEVKGGERRRDPRESMRGREIRGDVPGKAQEEEGESARVRGRGNRVAADALAVARRLLHVSHTSLKIAKVL